MAVGDACDDGYRLHALRKVRQQAEDLHKQAVASAVESTARAQARVDEQTLRLGRAREAERGAVERAAQRAAAGQASASDLVIARNYQRGLAAEIELERQALAATENMLEQMREVERAARDELAEAVRERKTVDEHHGRWQAEQKKQRARREEASEDDVAQSLHRRKR